MKKYAYKKIYLTWVAAIADAIGYRFRRPAPFTALAPRRILVVRLDQLGDIVQTLPVFDALRASFPEAQIDFLTTPVGAALFDVARPWVSCIEWNCAWFDGSRRPAVSTRELADNLKARAYDCVLELRGDARLIWFFKKAGIGPLIGYGATGAGFLLDVEAAWNPLTPAVDKNLELVKAIGARIGTDEPRITLEPQPEPASSPRIAIHPDAGTPAKKWSQEHIVEVIDAFLEKGFGVVLVGLNAAVGDAISARVKKPVENTMGKTNVPQLLEILNGCDGLLSNDSGPAHLMAALGKPVWVLWSGTALSSVWAPRGAHVEIFEHAVPCAPCSLARCPVAGHPCLEKISVMEVASAVFAHVRLAAQAAQK